MIALNKACSKIIFEDNGINTPRWEFLPFMPEDGWSSSLNFPIVVKPNCGGSSVDIEIVDNLHTLKRAMKNILEKNEAVLLEEKIEGKEITCGVLGDRALPPVLIEPASKSKFFDYYSKYTKGAAKEICPAPISSELTKNIMDIALKCHHVLGLSGYSRTDFIVTEDDIYVLEANTLPGMTATSLLPQEAAVIGIDFKGLIGRLIELGLK
jgi:D-alanine-D-alanine ligase